MSNYKEVNVNVLVGTVIVDIDSNSDGLTFTLQDGRKFEMYHVQDCCESVQLIDVIGEFSDLLDTPILNAEEISNADEKPLDPGWDISFTWTFYRFSTIKGTVVLRWYGASNGYYSESVSFFEVIAKD